MLDILCISNDNVRTIELIKLKFECGFTPVTVITNLRNVISDTWLHFACFQVIFLRFSKYKSAVCTLFTLMIKRTAGTSLRVLL